MDDKIKSDISDMKTDIAEIKINLAHHIQRTDDLQIMVEPLAKLQTELKVVVKLVYFISAVATIIEAVRMVWH